MLKQYLKGKNKSEFARQVGISYQHLDNILKLRSSALSVSIAMKIKHLSGLNPWDYLDGLDYLKKIIK